MTTGLTPQCAQYFPETLGQREAYGGWQVECTSLQEVDSDVSRRNLMVTPPEGSGTRARTSHLYQLSMPAPSRFPAASLQIVLCCLLWHVLLMRDASDPCHVGESREIIAWVKGLRAAMAMS